MSIIETLHCKNSYILVFRWTYCYLQNNIMDIAVDIVKYPDVINKAIAIKIKIINVGFLIIQVSFKLLESFRFLEQLHYGIEIKIIPGQTQIILLFILCYN